MSEGSQTPVDVEGLAETQVSPMLPSCIRHERNYSIEVIGVCGSILGLAVAVFVVNLFRSRGRADHSPKIVD